MKMSANFFKNREKLMYQSGPIKLIKSDIYSVYNIYTFVKIYSVLFASVPPITKVSPCKGEEDVNVEAENDEEEKNIKNESLKSPVDEKVLLFALL